MGESRSKEVVGQQFVGLCWQHCVPQNPSWAPGAKAGGDGRSSSPDTACYQEGGDAWDNEV